MINSFSYRLIDSQQVTAEISAEIPRDMTSAVYLSGVIDVTANPGGAFTMNIQGTFGGTDTRNPWGTWQTLDTVSVPTGTGTTLFSIVPNTADAYGGILWPRMRLNATPTDTTFSVWIVVKS